MKHLVSVSLAGSSLLGVKKDSECEQLCDQLVTQETSLSEQINQFCYNNE